MADGRNMARRSAPAVTIATPIGTTHSFFRHPHGTSHYQLAGPEGGDLVVLVPGATLPLDVWEPLVAPLAGLGFQVLRYDLAGRGHSSSFAVPAGLDADVAQLAQLLDGLGITRPVHLVGLASGALSVAAFAQRHRERVLRAALIAPDGTQTRFSLRERLFIAPLVGDLLIATMADRLLLARVPRYSSRADTREFIRELLRFALRGAHYRRAVLAYVRALPLHDGERHYARLAQTGVPVQVIWGGEDQITPAHAAQALRGIFGPDRIHVLDGLGHLPFVEEPIVVARLLAQHFAT